MKLSELKQIIRREIRAAINEYQPIKTGKIYNGADTLKPGTTFQMTNYTVKVVRDIGKYLIVTHHGENMNNKEMQVSKSLMKGAVILLTSIM